MRRTVLDNTLLLRTAHLSPPTHLFYQFSLRSPQIQGDIQRFYLFVSFSSENGDSNLPAGIPLCTGADGLIVDYLLYR